MLSGINCRRLAGPCAGVRPSQRPVAARTAAPEAAFDRAEADRLKGTDAFAELVRMNGKQSVNRPQKVRSRRLRLLRLGSGSANDGLPSSPTVYLCLVLSSSARLTGRYCYGGFMRRLRQSNWHGKVPAGWARGRTLAALLVSQPEQAF